MGKENRKKWCCSKSWN